MFVDLGRSGGLRSTTEPVSGNFILSSSSGVHQAMQEKCVHT